MWRAVRMGRRGSHKPWTDALVERAGHDSRLNARDGLPCKEAGWNMSLCRLLCPWPTAPTPPDPALAVEVEESARVAILLSAAMADMDAAKHALKAAAGVQRAAVAETQRTRERLVRILISEILPFAGTEDGFTLGLS